MGQGLMGLLLCQDGVVAVINHEDTLFVNFLSTTLLLITVVIVIVPFNFECWALTAQDPHLAHPRVFTNAPNHCLKAAACAPSNECGEKGPLEKLYTICLNSNFAWNKPRLCSLFLNRNQEVGPMRQPRTGSVDQ